MPLPFPSGVYQGQDVAWDIPRTAGETGDLKSLAFFFSASAGLPRREACSFSYLALALRCCGVWAYSNYH